MPEPIQNIGRSNLGLAAILALSGCAMDDEAQFREIVASWLDVGEQQFFESKFSCTAAIYTATTDEIDPSVTLASSIEEGVEVMEADEVIAFDDTSRSPNDVIDAVDAEHIGMAPAMIAAGISGKQCMPENFRKAFLSASADAGSILVVDQDNTLMAILDRANLRVYAVRGDV